MARKSEVDWSAAGRKAAATRRRNLAARAAVAPVTKFQMAEEAGNLVVKAAERNAVKKFLLEKHPSRPMCLFSLPATQWTLERAISKARPSTSFVCAEREKRVYNSPNQKRLSEEIADHVLGEAADVLGEYVGITALWYDAMCPLSGKGYDATIKALSGALDLTKPVPAVFTVQKGREPKSFYSKHRSGNPVVKRVKKLVSMLSAAGLAFEITDYRCYQSVVGSPMLNIFGIITKRAPGRWSGLHYGWKYITKRDLAKVCEIWPRCEIAKLVGIAPTPVGEWLDGKKEPDIISQLVIRKTIIEGKALPPKSTAERKRETRERSKRRDAARKAALPGVLEPLVAALSARKYDDVEKFISLAKERLAKIK